MTRTDFLNLPVNNQLTKVQESGELLINFLQGTKNITLYKINNILVKVVSVNEQSSIEVINESEIPRLFESNS